MKKLIMFGFVVFTTLRVVASDGTLDKLTQFQRPHSPSPDNNEVNASFATYLAQIKPDRDLDLGNMNFGHGCQTPKAITNNRLTPTKSTGRLTPRTPDQQRERLEKESELANIRKNYFGLR